MTPLFPPPNTLPSPRTEVAFPVSRRQTCQPMPVADETSSRVRVPQRVFEGSPTRTPVPQVGKLRCRPPKLSSFCCRRWPPKKLKTTSGHACPLFSLQTQTCIARQQTIGEFNHLPPVAHSGPSIDRIGQRRVAAELLCCLGRPIHRRPPCAARLVHRDIPPCKAENASRPRQSQPRRRHQPGKPFSPGVFPIPAARQTGISPCPSRSCFHEAFHGSPQARLSFARPTEPSSRGGQAVWGTQPASAPLISDPARPPLTPVLPSKLQAPPAHLQPSIRQNQNIFLQTKLIPSPASLVHPPRPSSLVSCGPSHHQSQPDCLS